MSFAVIALAGLVVATASADPTDTRGQRGGGVAELLGKSLVPSPDDEKLLREQAVSEEIARTLELVPGVTAARVHVQLAERGLLVRGATKPSAVAVVRVDPGAPSEALLRGIVQAAVPSAAPADVRVIAVPEAAMSSPVIERVGPFAVTAATAGTLRAACIAAFALIAVLSACLIIAGLRLRRLRRG